jgi:hypothetical protein
MNPSSKSILLSIVLLFLCACGGGSSSTAPPTVATVIAAPVVVLNAAPIANAGPDQNVSIGSTATLDAGASSDPNGDTLSFRWTLSSKPAGSAATLSNATSVRASFVPDVVGSFLATLIANDGKTDSLPVSVAINATAKVVVAKPIANAGPNQSANVGTTVSLDGSASSSPSARPLTYRWIFASKPSATAVLVNPLTQKPTFVADTIGTYTALLTVNDGIADSLPASVVINAVAPPSVTNAPPIANAGADQFVPIGATVGLDGSGSNDPNGDKLTYAWSFASKPQSSLASISSSNAPKASFVADVPGIYDVRLLVNDGKISSANPDTISVVTMSASTAVIADTGIYRCATLSKIQALLLYAQGHTYLDRDHDGNPCEANDISNELASPYVAPSTGSGRQCYVNGYYRKSGTYVHGYYRSCG